MKSRWELFSNEVSERIKADVLARGIVAQPVFLGNEIRYLHQDKCIVYVVTEDTFDFYSVTQDGCGWTDPIKVNTKTKQ